MNALMSTRTRTSHVLATIKQRKRLRSLRPRSNAQPDDSALHGLDTPQQAESAPRLLTLQEVAKILRVGRTTVWEMVNCGELNAVRFRGKLLIPCEEPERYLTELIEEGRASAATRRAVRRKSSTPPRFRT